MSAHEKKTGRKLSPSLVTAACLLLAAGGTVEDGTLRWIFISVAAVIGVILAIRHVES
jgi:hypothetical protein